MEKYDKTFVQAFLDGEVKEFDVNDWVEYWHDEYNGNAKLNEHLGLTEEEYKDWVEGPKSIGTIIKARLVERQTQLVQD